ncbi:hypothetical protein CROQUDRAFT_48716, partial [Cronartium quercuum f. sp. fusiforme G11]
IKSQETIPMARSVCFSDLPPEVLIDIIHAVRSLPGIHWDHVSRQRMRDKCVKITDPESEKVYEIYPDDGLPILNTLQALAVVSRNLYQVSRPILWKHLAFPSFVPGPMDIWTKSILPRNGHLVQTLAIPISNNCDTLAEELSPELWHKLIYENAAPELVQERFRNYATHEYLSAYSVYRLLSECFNIHTLTIQFRTREDGNPPRNLQRFLVRLIPLISDLKSLRHLIINYHGSPVVMNEFLIQTLRQLPLLRSFACGALQTSRGLAHKLFGYHCSQLRHLSQLKLTRLAHIDESWCLYNWPSNLTELALGLARDTQLQMELVCRFINHVGSNLTKLQLDLNGPHHNLDPEKVCFDLPMLTNLSLSCEDPVSLVCFQEFKTLQTLEHCYLDWTQWYIINDLICNLTWPCLQSISISSWITHKTGPELAKYAAGVDKLIEFCDENGIKNSIIV